MENTENLPDQQESIPLTEEQEEHLLALVTYLCNTYNALVGSVIKPSVETPETALEVDMQEFNGILGSLRQTAENFSNVLGVVIEGAQVETEHVDGE